MKTLKRIVLFTFIGLVGFAFKAAEKPTRYNVDINESNIVWVGKKVTGGHTGNISIAKGNLEMEEGKLVGGYFEIDMASMTCSDLNGKIADKLLGHLKSDDFFGVANHATSTLTITKALWQGENTYKITGDLTIKGITKEIRFPATVQEENGVITAKAEIVVDRAEYDIRYGSGSFFDNLGDKTIYDDFELTVQLVAKQ